MGITCLFGHKWDGCTCITCSKKRPYNHKFQGCKCSLCGFEEHSWKGCKCSVCGMTKDMGHVFNHCTCSICGAVNNRKHDWDGHGKCKICKCEVRDLYKKIMVGMNDHKVIEILGFPDVKMSDSEMFGMMGAVVFTSGNKAPDGISWRYRINDIVCDIYFESTSLTKLTGELRVASVKIY